MIDKDEVSVEKQTIDEILEKLEQKERKIIFNAIYLDQLTDVYNRKYFERVIVEAINNAEKTGNDVTLLFIDGNDFKKYQDHHPDGHLAGDFALYQIAQFLKLNVNPEKDAVCRYGGDEFAVICPDTNLEHGTKIASMLVAYMRNFAPINISIGVANYRGNADSVEELVLKASLNMKHAKKLVKESGIKDNGVTYNGKSFSPTPEKPAA